MNKIRLILLAPLGVVYGLIGRIRRWLYEHNCLRRFRPSLPTICIGNLAVGGTGKTPHVEYLIRLLTPHCRIATLSRGYKRRTKGFLSTMENSRLTAADMGDEPWQMHQKFPQVQVAVCECRSEAVRRLTAGLFSPEVILLDDAFQHLRVRCGLNILLTDFARPYGHDLPLPAGNLREFRSAARSADLIIVSKAPADLTEAKAADFVKKNRLSHCRQLFFSTLQYENPHPLTPPAIHFPLNRQTKILLVTGIAHPEPLVQYLQSQFDEIKQIEFPDHHRFSKKEVLLLCQKLAKSGKNAVFFTTEKDAARLSEENLKNIVSLHPFFSIPVKVTFLFDKEKEFNKIIYDYVGKN